MATHPKRPKDPFELAKLIGDIATGNAVETPPKKVTERATKGGTKGGPARARISPALLRRRAGRRPRQPRRLRRAAH
jgi:hypothetical protein